MKCSSGKRSFDSHTLAEEALIQHHIRNDYQKGQGPLNVYECQECGNWHFTSQGPEHELFGDPEMVKRIESERRAFLWERRLR
ncbi:hypothetical protein [Ekhidna sp.]|uniref:hypothetical protein n=1 Tax=Ekhidna sp. TaxID=2608089 RepID=UPI003B5CB0E6